MLELSYDEQLRIKRKNIITKLERIGALDDPTVREVVGAVDTIGADGGQAGRLRVLVILTARLSNQSLDTVTRLSLPVAMTSAGPLVGFNKRGSNKIVDCTDCLLQKRATMAAAMQSAISYRTS